MTLDDPLDYLMVSLLLSGISIPVCPLDVGEHLIGQAFFWSDDHLPFMLVGLFDNVITSFAMKDEAGMDFQSIQKNFEQIVASVMGTDQNSASHSNQGNIRLNEIEMYGLMKLAGLDPCDGLYLPKNSGKEEQERWAQAAIELGSKVGKILIKVVGRTILHKTDVGGVKIVKLENSTPNYILDQLEELKTQLSSADLDDSIEGFMAGEFVPHQANTAGHEVLLSLRQDPAFGPCVVVGIGGTLTEWYGKGSDGQSTLIFPAQGLASSFVENALVSHPFLQILCVPSRLYREAPVPAKELVKWILTLASLGNFFGPRGDGSLTLEEIEINPAVASHGKLVALDGVGLLSRRKWNTETRPTGKIQPLLHPDSAVVLGVSAKGANPGRIILENLKRSEGMTKDRVYVVHPKEESIGGVPCFASVEDLPEKCDLAVVSVPAQGAFDAISELVKLAKAESIILIPGGFAEAGENDLAEKIETALRKGHQEDGGGPVLVGGNCLGIVSRSEYNTFFLPQYKLPFNPGLGENLAIVSQSGAYLVTFASNYDGIINPAASISYGNQMDLTVSDFVEHFNGVEAVNVMACYIEGFRDGDGERFMEQAREARARGKVVIAFKAGKTALGAQAAASHTASLAGDYAVAHACLEAAGVVVADSLDHFEDLIKTFTLLADKELKGRKVGIISNAGFECSTVMDQLDGLELAAFDEESQDILDRILPGFAHRTNPIDCTPMVGTDPFCESCRAILSCETVDLAILSSVPVTPALENLPADLEGRHRENLESPESQPMRMIGVCRASAKPAVVVVDSGKIYDPMCRLIEEAGIPVFRKIDRAARSLAAFCGVKTSE